MPPPGNAATALAELTALRNGLVVTDPDVVASHERDSAPFCPNGSAAALVRPSTVEEVSAVLRAAHRHGVPVVPQGARTGLAGGANAIDGCLLLSLERMNRIRSIDTTNAVAVVEPGVVNAVLSRAVAEKGLFYPPDPSSWESSTIGGNVATNAGGLCCVKYGVTAEYVRGLQIVLADGRVVRTGRSTAKGVAGYDLTRLFVGSEGTLGVVTEVTLALRPAAGGALTAVSFFPDAASACATVCDYMAGGGQPSLLELMDRLSMDVVRRYKDLGFPDGAGAMVLMQSDRGALAAQDLAEFEKVATGHGGDVVLAENAAESAMLLEARRSVGVATELLGSFISEDACVPRSALVDLVVGVERISRDNDVLITCTGHAGDGNMHPTVVFDPADPEQVRRAGVAFDQVMKLALDLGGTITGEHGVGLLKAEWLETELGADGLELQRDIKRTLDPTGILNPGKVLRS
ncbi:MULTISPECIES: FAD-binding oxidoreductase [Pseudonocardia]|uniref:FAD-linked oxidase n=2 Tax=Pseudonocardia TaxID=1847 RepID=A0ABQ0RZL2_9PSEU|nr:MULTISPECIES: FAD-linked oxidase C-terminal domain-containing protein [Pseudonocardia]OSY38889.1 putative FAD-linked oxidoreductase [Pseudonocardia autotrophica]TDN76145.1 glycolate oxidase [Pseudonocardia autotrophica]BBG00126.1 FAD-linked oxidase [Pseudonocardia autotrophica]GEC26091.1 FAD-linked oxidase [Pseudonocardia saturnea]